MADLIAWAPITAPDKVTKGKWITIPVGAKVSRNDLPEGEFDNLVAAGVLRKKQYPKDIRSDESPRNAILRKVNEEIKTLSEPFKHELDEDEDDGDTGQS